MAKQTYKKHVNKNKNHNAPPSNFQKKEKITDITYEDGITVANLAKKLNKNSGEIIKVLFMLGKMVTINSALDDEDVELVCVNFDVNATKEEKREDDSLVDDEADNPEDLKERAPIVTIIAMVIDSISCATTGSRQEYRTCFFHFTPRGIVIGVLGIIERVLKGQSQRQDPVIRKHHNACNAVHYSSTVFVIRIGTARE